MQSMRGGKQIQVEAYDRSQQGNLATGKLITVDNQIDTTTGTVKLRAAFDNRDGKLFPNQFVNTRLLVKILQNQTVIPNSAVQHNGNTDFVYLIQNGNAVQLSVKTGSSDDRETVIQGLQPGDVVANSSFEKLQNGSQITISKVQLPATSDDSAGDDVP
jgi:multidrug efflux system membrane fusion protein